jgi:DNA-binding NtrC family response regulator
MDYPPQAHLVLLVVSGPAQSTRIPLDRPILLGRDTRSRIPFDDERVSRHHALVDYIDQRPILRDLGSKNGTFVNGNEIRDFHFLRPDDRIRLGNTQIVVIALDNEDAAPLRSLSTGSETQADTDTPSNSLRMNRRILRQATELVGKLAPYARTRFPLYPVLSGIRREFRADGAGVFLTQPPVQPVYIEGDLLLSGDLLEAMRARLAEAPIHGSFRLASDEQGCGSVIGFPLRAGDEVRHFCLLRRETGRPFGDEYLELAEALSECLQMLPLGDLLASAGGASADSLSQLIGSGETLSRAREQIQTYAVANATVLITGESGTGKELSARALYQLSNRRFSPYVEVNCACMLPDLMESDLFGHEKGAFTGATARTLGKLEIANGGTLFLDEIGELPLDLQAKLLRVLEGQPFYRVGGRELISVDVRFICATNRPLEEMVAAGTFRGDLYHRINILRLNLPPLRNHLEDIPEIIQFLMASIEDEMGADRKFTLNPKAYRLLLSHTWPGNVRELRNVLQRMMLLSTSNVLDERMIPPEIGSREDSTTLKLPRLQVLTEMLEREEISRVLLACEGQKAKSARMLGISRPTLDKKIRQYGLAGLIAKGREDEAEEASEE